MIDIKFFPDSDREDFSSAVKEFENIWQAEGKGILQAWVEVTGLSFKETYINAVIFNGISHSHPLSFRYNLDSISKKRVLIHELGHRLLSAHIPGKVASSLEVHKGLDLVLYDVYLKLGGEELADGAVEWDCNLPRPEYKEAWEWALKFSDEERNKKFKQVLEQGYFVL